MNAMWREQLAHEKSGEIRLCTNEVQTVLKQLKNGSTVVCGNTRGRMVVVLAGECDVVQGNGRYRLTAGSWISIPGGNKYAIHVFRTCEDCCVVQAETASTATSMVTSNAFDMPAMDGVVYFGLETTDLVGLLQEEQTPVPANALSFPLKKEGREYQLVISPKVDDHQYVAWMKEKYGILWGSGYGGI